MIDYRAWLNVYHMALSAGMLQGQAFIFADAWLLARRAERGQ